MKTSYRVEVLRMDGGERFPLLVVQQIGVPDPPSVRYAVSHLRPLSVNTGMKVLNAVGLFYEWAEHASINLDERFGSGDLFDSDEVASLAERLRLSKRRSVDLEGARVPLPVLGETHANRLRYVGDFIKWRSERIVQAMPLSDPRVAPAAGRLTRVVEQLNSLATRGRGRVRLGLTMDQQIRLFEIVKPDAPENPFHPATQYRNFVLMLLYWELGLRKAEPLILKGADVTTSDPHMPRIVIEPRPDDPGDSRTVPALVKTAGRVLPASLILARSLDEYMIRHRSRVPNARRTSYVFLETKHGRPMSLSAVYDVFTVLRNRFPSDFGTAFSPHVLRHTWNDRFKAQARRLGMTDAKRRSVGNYIMGWSKTSDQETNYGRRETEEAAQHILLTLQSQMLGVIS